MSGFPQHEELTKNLGKYKTGEACLYVNKLADIDLGVLRELVERSVSYTARTYGEQSPAPRSTLIHPTYRIMRSLCYGLVLAGLSLVAWPGCTSNAGQTPASDTTAVSFDSLLAARLGADDFGMKRYVMAFLKAGPNRDQDSARAAELQRAHLQNISRMAEAGNLVLAGPFLDDGEVRGIYVFDVETVDEARALTATDPAIQAGRLEMELHPWYGSAALMRVNEIHRTLARQNP